MKFISAFTCLLLSICLCEYSTVYALIDDPSVDSTYDSSYVTIEFIAEPRAVQTLGPAIEVWATGL